MATTECRFGGGLNASSGGELKLYLKWKRNTYAEHVHTAQTWIWIPIWTGIPNRYCTHTVPISVPELEFESVSTTLHVRQCK